MQNNKEKTNYLLNKQTLAQQKLKSAIQEKKKKNINKTLNWAQQNH